MEDGSFPRSVKLGGPLEDSNAFDCRAVAWIEDEVEQWIDSRIEERDIGSTDLPVGQNDERYIMDLKSERPSFLIYKADYDSIKNLSDQNLGKLFRAIFEYHNDKELKLEPEVQMALNFLKKQLQLDHIKWEKKVAAQRANGKKGGRPKSSDGIDSGEEKPNQTQKT